MPKDMEEILKGLLEAKVDETQLEKVLKDKDYSEGDTAVLKAAHRLVASSKDLPKDFLKTLATLTGFEFEKAVEKKEVKEEKVEKKDPPKTDQEAILDSISKEFRPEMEKILKENADTKVKLQKEIDLRITKEFVEKAAKDYDQFGTSAEFGPMLKQCAEKLDEKSFDGMSTILKSVNEQLKEADLYKERGTGLALVGDAESKIDKLAEAHAKEHKITKEAAYTEVITKSTEGQKLYEQARQEKAHKVREAV